MKSCRKKRSALLSLAVNSLPEEEERSLRAHLQTCPGCRELFESTRMLTEKLERVPVRTDIETSGRFHQNLIRRVRAQEQAPGWQRVARWLMADNWRVAWPALATAVLIAAIIGLRGKPEPGNPQPVAPAATAALKTQEMPTLSSYKIAASRSLEQLDELLTRQGMSAQSSAPIYKPTTRVRDGLDLALR